MKRIAVMAVHYGKEYLAWAVQSLALTCDEIHVFYTPTPSFSFTENTPCPDTEDELFAEANRFKPPKLIWHNKLGHLGSESIHRGMMTQTAINVGAKFMVIVDADEVWSPAALDQAFATVEAANMGIPRWNTTKHKVIEYHGSTVGRRSVLIPFLIQYLQPDLVDLSGNFGRQLIGNIDTAAASLYVAHSDVFSFSTWRIWQTVSTSSCLISEPGDTWPFEPGKHFIQIHKITAENANLVADDIRRLTSQRDLLIQTATAAHEEIAQKYTVGYIEDTYLVPAVVDLIKDREIL